MLSIPSRVNTVTHYMQAKQFAIYIQEFQIIWESLPLLLEKSHLNSLKILRDTKKR